MIEDYLSEKHKKKKKKRRLGFAIVAAVLGVAVFAGLFWFFFRSPVFKLQEIDVQGNVAVPTSEITALLHENLTNDHDHFILWLFGQNNMLIWPGTVAPSELATIPQIASLSISKDYWSHTITATVTERQPFAIWCFMPQLDANGNPESDESCYWFDDTGTMFESAFDTQGNAIFAVHDYASMNAQDSATSTAELLQPVLPQPFTPNVISILNVLKQSDLNIKEIALNTMSLEEIDVSTYNGPTIYFSLQFPSDEDLGVLQSLMEKPDFDTLQYVDFRVENRAFYK